MKSLISRPIHRLLRCESLLTTILRDTSAVDEDLGTIPIILGVLKGIGKEMEPGVASAKRKVEMWGYNAYYNANLVLEAGERIVRLSVRTHVQC